MNGTDERDIRLNVANDFGVLQKGIMIGKVSKETIEKMPKGVSRNGDYGKGK